MINFFNFEHLFLRVQLFEANLSARLKDSLADAETKPYGNIVILLVGLLYNLIAVPIILIGYTWILVSIRIALKIILPILAVFFMVGLYTDHLSFALSSKYTNWAEAFLSLSFEIAVLIFFVAFVWVVLRRYYDAIKDE